MGTPSAGPLPEGRKSAISVLILTLNEEVNLPDCLKSLAWCDDVVVFDSFSTDATVRIAQASGARVICRTFDDYAAQRNAALHEVTYRHPWVLMLDADERVPPELCEEMTARVAAADDNTDMFCMRRKDYFQGRWLRRSSGYPTWFGRLVRPSRVTVQRAINEEFHPVGDTGFLKNHLIHYPFNKGVAYWCERHNRYSSLEAAVLVGERRAALCWRDLLSRNPPTRRKALKQLAYRLPARPLLFFFYLYLLRLGLFDGIPGLTYAALRAYYEMLIDLKIKELRRRAAGLAI